MIYFNIGPDGQLYNSPLGICGRCEVKIESGNVCEKCMTTRERELHSVNNHFTKEHIANLLRALEESADEDWKQWRLL